MNTIQFKKLHPDAKAPSRAHPTDAGFDLYALRTWKVGVSPQTCGTGVAVAIPDGYVGILKERSSIRDRGLVLSGGVIDAGYTGEIMATFHKLDEFSREYEPGEKCCQLLIIPCPQFEMQEVNELPKSERGEKGFGSTGN